MAVSEQLGPEQHVELKQGRIAYRELGEGEPIVFVHGVLVNGDLWRDVAPALADRYRCIVPDWPLGSHSEPMNEDADLSTPGLARIVHDFLEALDLENVTLVGNDTGGAVCQLVVTRHPERIGRLVLASCDAFEVFPPKPFGFLKWVWRVPGALFLIAQNLRVPLARRTPIAYGWVTREPLDRHIGDSYTSPGLRPGIRRDIKNVLRGVDTNDLLDAASRFGEFKRPVLVAWAANDRLFPQELGDRLAAAFPNSERVSVERSGTFIGEDEPEQLAQLMHDFIEKTPTRAAARAAHS